VYSVHNEVLSKQRKLRGYTISDYPGRPHIATAIKLYILLTSE